jgi:hypothetical protein
MEFDGGMDGGEHLLKTLGMIEALGRKGLKSKAFCLFLTDKGIILIQEIIRDEVVPGAFGYSSTKTREHVHPEVEDLAKLTENKDSVIIPYEKIRGIWIAKGFSSTTMRREYKITIEYLDPSEKQRRFLADIVPPLPPNVHGQGLKRDRAASIRAYVLEAEETLRRALPDNMGIISDFSL